MNSKIPVITIDGPSGCGKGTIAQLLAKKLRWHFLDSGAIYRALGWAVINAKIDPADHASIQSLINDIKIEMHASSVGDDAKIIVNNHDITDEIRSETCAQMASITSAIPLVRAALMDRQRAMRQLPGLVTDGRDMGTVVFPDATLKFYFEASVEERAKRRFNQLKRKGKHVSLPVILSELRERDERDVNRAIAPLKPADDVVLVDTTHSDVEGVFESVLKEVRTRGF
ncbi:MAG: (d)CMP kinase [Gammaproteobacteria bacterium]|nr:(d)CMP kinase [Gammaproteobacteria bacterium]